MSPTKQKGKSSSNQTSKKLAPEQVKEMYRQMLLIRRFEEKTGQQYQMKKFSGFCHLYIGQEAVVVGTYHAMEIGLDYMFTTYRDHGHALLWGIPANEVMAELFMRTTGSSKGKGGSMHFYNGKNRYMGGNGIVGGHTPLAGGVAFASKYRNEGAVAVCFMGDAAVNQGTFHETLNMCGLWKLPAVFVVENNIYGMGTSVERSCAQPELYKRTEDAYKIPGYRVNGMDIHDVHETMSKAIKDARENNQPSFVEMVCYRYRGHSMSDPATTYRDKDEVNEWKLKDPIDMLKEAYPDVVTDELVKEYEDEIKEEVAESIKFAEESDFPPQSDIHTHVYANYPGYPGPDVNPSKYAFPYDEYGGI